MSRTRSARIRAWPARPIRHHGVEHESTGDRMTSNGWIDVNAELGPAVGRAAGAPLERLTAERDHHGVGVSLVRSRAALLGDTQTGNARLLDACDGHAGLLLVAVLSPEK